MTQSEAGPQSSPRAMASLNGGQGELVAEGVSHGFFGVDVLGEEIGMLFAGEHESGGRGEDAEDTGEARHPQVIGFVIGDAGGLDGAPDIGELPGVEREPVVDKLATVGDSGVAGERGEFGARGRLLGSHAHDIEDPTRPARGGEVGG